VALLKLTSGVQAMRRKAAKSVPADIYIPFVQSLYADAYILLLGGTIQGLTALIVYLQNGKEIYLVLAAALLGAGLFRYAGIRKYENEPAPESSAVARRWELDYLFRGTVQGSLLGFYCFVALYLVPDSLAEIASIAVTLASAIAIVGRNYASNRMVLILSMTMTLPISAGVILRGDFYNIALGLLFIPFFVAIIQMARRVRETFLAVIYEKKKASSLAHRFNRALNTMSHGLVMLDTQARVAVANAEAAQLMAVSSPDLLLGRTLKGLLMRGVAGGMLSLRDSRYVESQLTRALREGRDRKVLVSFTNGRHYEFSAREGRDELGVITFEDVTSRLAAEEKIRYMARYDNLTGLPNRAYFHELVHGYMAAGDRGRFCALAVLDLDDFKNINDTLGHPVGDGLIYSVAQRLTALVSETVKISRFGGDEFMIYIDSIASEPDLELALESLFAALGPEVDVAGHSLKIQASAGAVLSRVGETDVDSMFVKADLALYKAKEYGKNGWRLFESVMDAEFRNRQLLKADLRAAIEGNGLRVVYQPIVAMDTMRIASCEALCRWDHPRLGPISPAVFIPLAEEMGIISSLSAFVLSAACAECTKWPDQIRVSVNLSAKDFRTRDIVQLVQDVLVESGLAADRLEIEVTETALLDDKSSTKLFLEELKALGVRIALDDFGTGYSSLSYLHTLPLDKVKIDRSFIEDITRNERSLELLRGVVNLSRPLGLAVTIEGVETFEQLKVLAQVVKPDLVQGFLFGSALTASGIETMSTTVWPFARDLQPVRKFAAG
jgi:diguanylate cyclase (GGDEF)-like protein